ncbi:hypothetical protein E2C01_020444 [Portunus trituberculatus]|uniref:Uncharacterized protein n=1 Tax=Portunus trituberculatus TaxID=210409 RepID=A0A5B7E2A9_PORTR|nr:hypothetical protein [Portunus trituberculatus]
MICRLEKESNAGGLLNTENPPAGRGSAGQDEGEEKERRGLKEGQGGEPAEGTNMKEGKGNIQIC